MLTKEAILLSYELYTSKLKWLKSKIQNYMQQNEFWHIGVLNTEKCNTYINKILYYLLSNKYQ